MFLGMNRESSHSDIHVEPAPYSANIVIVAGSVTGVAKTGWFTVGGMEAVVCWVLDGGIKVVVGMAEGGWLSVDWIKTAGCLDRVG